jgi:hypothetical protein
VVVGFYYLDSGFVLVVVLVEVPEAEVAARGGLTVDVGEEEEDSVGG